MKNIFIMFAVFFLSSCDRHFKNDDMYGYYAPVGYNNTFDTIVLQENSTYHRRVFDRAHRLVLEMNGKWEIENNNTIRFHSFFLNLDSDIVRFSNLLADTLNDGGGVIEKRNNVLGFCVGYFPNENCYRRVK